MTPTQHQALPERIELGDGWHLLLTFTGGDERFPEYIICDPEGDRLGMTVKHVTELMRALSRPAPASGTATHPIPTGERPKRTKEVEDALWTLQCNHPYTQTMVDASNSKVIFDYIAQLEAHPHTADGLPIPPSPAWKFKLGDRVTKIKGSNNTLRLPPRPGIKRACPKCGIHHTERKELLECLAEKD